MLSAIIQPLSLSVSHISIVTDQDLDRSDLFREAASTFSAPIFSITSIRSVCAGHGGRDKKTHRDSFAPRLVGMKAMESTLSREGIIANFDPSVYCSRVPFPLPRARPPR